jgi:hypothetical protein
MALGPNIRIEDKEGLLMEESIPNSQANNNDDDDFKPYRYYESFKILGQLYRAIDEHKIFSDIKRQQRVQTRNGPELLEKVWAHATKICKPHGIKWKGKLLWARDLRDM